jgi:hypothetical protein
MHSTLIRRFAHDADRPELWIEFVTGITPDDEKTLEQLLKGL